MPKTKSSKADKKKSSKKTSRKVKNTESKTETKVQSTPVVLQETKTAETKTRRTRRVVNKASLLETCDTLLTDLTTEISKLKESNKKVVGVKFLKSLNKRVRVLRSDINRVVKERKRTVRSGENRSSGFMKPVEISSDMASFTGWDKNTPRSRVDVTKFLCNYIREHNLQNPDDRRQIVPDRKLRKLLGIEKKDKTPLYYYTMQKKIQHHFVKSG